MATDYAGWPLVNTDTVPPHMPHRQLHIAWPPTSLSSLPITLPLAPSSPSLTSLSPITQHHGRSNTQRYRGAVHPRHRYRIGQQHSSGAAPDRSPFWHRKVLPNVQTDDSSTTMRARQRRESSVSSTLATGVTSPTLPFPRLSPLPSSPPSAFLTHIQTQITNTADLREKDTDFTPRRASFSAESKQYCMNVYVAYARWVGPLRVPWSC